MKPDHSESQGISLPQVLIGFAIMAGIGILSFFVVLSMKRSIAKSLVEPNMIEVSLPSVSALPEEISVLQRLNDPVGIRKFIDQVPLEGPESAEAVDGAPIELLSIPKYVQIPKQLRKPDLSVVPGEYPRTRFPLTVSVSNPNVSATWTMISVNDSQFTKMESETVIVRPGDKIRVYARGDTREWVESEVVNGRYVLPPTGAKPYRAPVRRIKFGNR